MGPEGIGASCVDGDEFNAFPGPKKPRNMAAETEWPKGVKMVKYFDLKWPSQKHFRFCPCHKSKLCVFLAVPKAYATF